MDLLLRQFRGFQCFCCAKGRAKEENMVLRCVVYGCSDKKDGKRGFISTKLPSTVIQDRKP